MVVEVVYILFFLFALQDKMCYTLMIIEKRNFSTKKYHDFITDLFKIVL